MTNHGASPTTSLPVIARMDKVLTWQSSGTMGHPIASSGHPVPRFRLDCHVSSLRDLPRNDKK
ncbi:MAG: hypothetical protein O3A82_10770 [Verrucomicrobia bacterium]|nr:hypothetical protein [Verrucomicrobiota bacterium]MDA0725011.1 hypothetical protein [Verrucomicrobiota bacterium]MDA1047398.1 hypothetical protein [Verrucomicrobiota bacterium]